MAETKSIVGTETQKNLAKAYVAESTAYTRYTFYASQATKELYFDYANIFNETADNELRHAKIFFKYLNEANAECPSVEIDAGKIGPTVENLKVAAREEEMEGVNFYRKSSETAKKEGFDDIADHFAAIATIEQHHRDRFLAMIKRIEDDTVWKSEKPVKWQCLVCGYISEGTEPPKKCPACDHPYNHTRRLEEFI